MFNHIKYIFFDLGSTIVDESECYKIRYKEAAECLNITAEEFENKVIEFSRQNKRGDHEAVKYYGIPLPKWHKEAEKLYDGAELVLKFLTGKGYKLGVIANQSFGTNKRLEKWGIAHYFDLVLASAEEGLAKPDIIIFKRALNMAQCLPENAIMIGDRLDNDIAPAKAIGIKTIWMKQGLNGLATVQSEKEKPDYEVKSLHELIDIL